MLQAIATSMIRCTFGAASIPLVALPVSRTTAVKRPAATIMDHKPLVNIATFGLCSAPTNPAVIAATAAKLGVFTPVPCVPATPLPWLTGNPRVLLGKMPALNQTSICNCLWLGVISINSTNQGTVKV